MTDETAVRDMRGRHRGVGPSPLAELAGAYGVATEYFDWQGERVEVPRRTVAAVLAVLGVDAADDEDAQVALRDLALVPWRRLLPPVIVTTRGTPAQVRAHMPAGTEVTLTLVLEDGTARTPERLSATATPRDVDGTMVAEAVFELPEDLPLGYHVLHGRSAGVAGHVEPAEADCQVIVTPARISRPPALDERRWGYLLQLYALRSERSWGIGDFADLREFADIAGRRHQADFVLVNPLHAAQPVPPVEDSPYLPTSRMFLSPLYIRVEDVPEAAYLASTDRAVVDWQGEALRQTNRADGLIDRNAVWEAKKLALETVHTVPRSPSREAAFQRFLARAGAPLHRFALWCALAERYGLPPTGWPDFARTPDSDGVRELEPELAGRIAFYEWLQWIADEQLGRAQVQAKDAGMGLGVVTDLAVGVHPEGADAWILRDVLTRGVSTGAPPDAYNQQGQNWSQPPWHPRALAEAAYRPFRDVVRAALRHAGGLRMDHVMGLFRLWWIPDGLGPGEGTYVHYDYDALVGILALEAERAGAFVVGEDLGVVEPWVRDYLAERGVAGTSILWFENGSDGQPLPPAAYRENCLATVTSHDLMPTAAYLDGAHIDLRESLGLLTRPVAVERAEDRRHTDAVLRLLRRIGLLAADATERQRVEALHAFLALTPARLLGVSLPDAVGDRRAENQPGTFDEYPNWKLPLADGAGRPVLVEDLPGNPRAAELARLVNAGLGRIPD